MAKLSLFDRRRRRVRSTLRARAAGKPRLSVHRSGRHIYAQVIDDAAGKTLASASSLDKDLKVMDLTAATLCKDTGTKIYVFALAQEGNLMKVINGENVGTLIQ